MPRVSVEWKYIRSAVSMGTPLAAVAWSLLYQPFTKDVRGEFQCGAKEVQEPRIHKNATASRLLLYILSYALFTIYVGLQAVASSKTPKGWDVVSVFGRTPERDGFGQLQISFSDGTFGMHINIFIKDQHVQWAALTIRAFLLGTTKNVSIGFDMNSQITPIGRDRHIWGQLDTFDLIWLIAL